MKKLDVKMLEPLLIATNDYIEICKGLPADKQFMFRIEKIKVLDKWEELYTSVMTELNPAKEKNEKLFLLNNISCHKLAFYFHLIAKFYQDAVQDPQDLPYINGVYHFFKIYKELGPMDYESLFWKAFPKEKE